MVPWQCCATCSLFGRHLIDVSVIFRGPADMEIRFSYRMNDLHFRAQLPSPYPGPCNSPIQMLLYPQWGCTTVLDSSWVLTEEGVSSPQCPPDEVCFFKLRRNCGSCPICYHQPPVSVCMLLLLTPLNSPEEDLPWQGPEKKEEACWNKSCHSAGTLESFLSSAAKVREQVSLWESQQYRALLQLGLE